MKVLLVVPSLKKTGVTEVVKSLICENKKNSGNVNYYLVSLKNDNGNNVSEFKKLLGENIFILDGKSILSPRKIIKFKRVVRNIKPSIIHFHAFESDIYSIFLNHKKYKIVSTAHNNGKEDFQSTYGTLVGSLMAVAQVLLFNRMDLVIAVSDTVKRQFDNIIRSNIDIVLNGVNDNDDDSLGKTIKMGVLVKPIGIYSGNLSSRKNVDILFETYKKINFSKIRSSLIVLGDDPQDSQKLIRYNIKYKGYGIVFVGRVNNVYPYLSMANYWVSASKNEGLPMAAIEGMSKNLDLILSDIPQHRELKVSNKQNILFFQNNLKGLTNVLKKYMDNWTPKHISNNEYYFKRYFSSKIMYDKYVTEYRKIIK
ncbi:glycosyltransferase [Limosilactobacillus pontis]|uniref:glycosyltransferase n=1 Tax=Limosilactobacillus pontis TaxID=35787 RepID=UPI002F267C9D